MEEQKMLMLNFEGKPVRSTWFQGKQRFSVVDVVDILTESSDANDYWYRLKNRVRKDSQIELSTYCRRLKLKASDGKLRETDCADKRSMLRIIQSIPSRKSEPFKQWLAQVGYERLEEIKNPELAINRGMQFYENKGHSPLWINKRVQSIAYRKAFTNDLKERGIEFGWQYAAITNEVYYCAFGMKSEDYKEFKGLQKKDNLRDNMTSEELAIASLGEVITIRANQKKNARGFDECRDSAQLGGEVAGKARKFAEEKLGESLINPSNFLDEPKKVKKISMKE